MSPASTRPIASSSTIGPLVAVAVALDPEQAGDPAVVLVDVQQVVGLERAERQPEQAEHADPRAAHRQAERAGVASSLWASRDSSPSGGEVGQAGQPDLAREAHRERLIERASSGRPLPADRMVAPAGALARIVVLGGHRGHEPVEAGLAGQLGVERGGDHVPLPHGHDPAVVEPGQDVDARARRAR